MALSTQKASELASLRQGMTTETSSSGTEAGGGKAGWLDVATLGMLANIITRQKAGFIRLGRWQCAAPNDCGCWRLRRKALTSLPSSGRAGDYNGVDVLGLRREDKGSGETSDL